MFYFLFKFVCLGKMLTFGAKILFFCDFNLQFFAKQLFLKFVLLLITTKFLQDKICFGTKLKFDVENFSIKNFFENQTCKIFPKLFPKTSTTGFPKNEITFCVCAIIKKLLFFIITNFLFTEKSAFAGTKNFKLSFLISIPKSLKPQKQRFSTFPQNSPSKIEITFFSKKSVCFTKTPFKKYMNYFKKCFFENLL